MQPHDLPAPAVLLHVVQHWQQKQHTALLRHEMHRNDRLQADERWISVSKAQRIHLNSWMNRMPTCVLQSCVHIELRAPEKACLHEASSRSLAGPFPQTPCYFLQSLYTTMPPVNRQSPLPTLARVVRKVLL